MGRKEFDVSELDIIDYRKCGAMAIFKPLFGGNVPPEPVYNTPITPKENWRLAAAGKNLTGSREEDGDSAISMYSDPESIPTAS